MELLKLRRSHVFWLIVLIPLLFTAANGSLYFGSSQAGLDILRIVTFQIFLLFIYPLLMTFVISIIVQMERKHDGIKNILLSPIQKWQMYVNKVLLLFLLNMIILTVSYAVLFIMTMIFDLHTSLQFFDEFTRFSSMLLAGTLICSIQLLVTIYFSRIIMPIIFAILLTITGAFAATHPVFSHFHLWSYPVRALYNGYNLYTLSIVSFLLLLIFTLIGVYLFPRKAMVSR